jgi:hypothetical protein
VFADVIFDVNSQDGCKLSFEKQSVFRETFEIQKSALNQYHRCRESTFLYLLLSLSNSIEKFKDFRDSDVLLCEIDCFPSLNSLNKLNEFG